MVLAGRGGFVLEAPGDERREHPRAHLQHLGAHEELLGLKVHTLLAPQALEDPRGLAF